MRVAWLTHQFPSVEGAENGENLLPGRFPGGAERSNHNRIEARPEGVKVTLVHPRNWTDALSYDQIIIGATDLLSEAAMIELSTRNYSIAPMHPHPVTWSNKLLFENARVVIGLTPTHLQGSLHDYNVKRSEWVLSPVELPKIQVKEKEEFALHAARRDWWKGADQAQEWADSKGIPLTIMQKETHETVLEAMSRAKYFVHLPLILDAEPTACIEAVLSGCQVIPNLNVGLISVPDWDSPKALEKRIETAGSDFWQIALN